MECDGSLLVDAQKVFQGQLLTSCFLPWSYEMERKLVGGPVTCNRHL